VKLFHKKQSTKEEKQQPAPASTDEEYKVKAIINHHDQKNSHTYKVQWVGYTTTRQHMGTSHQHPSQPPHPGLP
jgi:hypothetical protein